MNIRNFKIKAIEKALHFVLATTFILSLSTLVSCSSDETEINTTPSSDATLEVKLTIQTRAEVEGFSEGSQWENYINIAGGNYRIYFFTNDKDDANATSDSEKNTLIAVFNPFDVTVVDGSNYTEYQVTGNILETIADYSSFKVVVLANWGYASISDYPTVTPGVTTIDDLCENENSTFEASRFLENGVTSSRLIPFFGVNEYNNVTWEKDTYTDLSSTEIMMLRALAKVEVIRADEKLGEFSSVSITRYNANGYSAPKNVYLREDYFHNYTWDEDFTSSLHLVGDANDVDEMDAPKTYSFIKEADTDTWVIYLPEYDNSGEDYSYITVTFSDGTEKIIYFGNYVDGECTAYDEDGDSDDRFDIYRNYYYSFTVNYVDRAVINSYYFDLNAPSWSNHFQNDSSTDLIKHD